MLKNLIASASVFINWNLSEVNQYFLFINFTQNIEENNIYYCNINFTHL